MHLSFVDLRATIDTQYGPRKTDSHFAEDADLDGAIFYHQPPSFFAVDTRIPRRLRDLIVEAETSQKMNLLTGASACIRKAIYELLVLQGAAGDDYQAKVKSLKEKYANIYPGYFDELATALELTSDQVHELSWADFDGEHCKLLLETLKSVLHEMYVVPEEQAERTKEVQRLRERLVRGKEKRSPG